MSKHHSKHHQDELPSIDVAALKSVTGGAGDMSSMLPMMMMMKKRNETAMAAPAAPPAPPKPKILLNGVEQPASALAGSGNGPTFETTV
jgi:hypothetical protein